MELTKEQLELAQKGEVVRVPTDSGEIVIVKAEVYDNLVHTPDYDDSEWTEDEMRATAARTFEDADNAGPIP